MATAARKTATTSSATRSVAKRSAATTATKKPAAKKTGPAKKQAAAKKTAPKKQAPAKKTAPAKKQAAAKKTAPKKHAAAKKTAAKKTAPKKQAPAKKQAAAKTTAAKKTAPKKQAPAKQTAPAKKHAPDRGSATPRTVNDEKGPTTDVSASPPSVPAGHFELPAPRGTSKDGISYTKDFDVKFLRAQREALVAERARLLGQATSLEDEAHQLMEEGEMGDVQFDDEGGEGDTMVVERERDLALSSQARQTIIDIEAALTRIEAGSYGYSVLSGNPIPRERLEAIPWATELVQEKVGGIGRR